MRPKTLSFQVPPDWDDLPHEIQRLVMLDLLQQRQARSGVGSLPKGISFYDVWKRARNCPTVFSLGSGSKDQFDGYESFTMELALVRSLIGVSEVNGGGPALMKLAAKSNQTANSITAKYEGLKRRFVPRVFQVLLNLPSERPNGYGDEGCVVRAIDNLDARTPMSIALGKPLAALIYPNGFGTLEELFRLMCGNQLHPHLKSVLKRQVPVILLDHKEESSGALWFDELNGFFERMARTGTIGSGDLNAIHRVNVDQPDAVRKTMNIIDQSARELFKVSLIREWEEKNREKLLPTARKLMVLVKPIHQPRNPQTPCLRKMSLR